MAQTALQAISDFTVHVVKDATFSRFVHDWEIASNRMQYNGIRDAYLRITYKGWASLNSEKRCD